MAHYDFSTLGSGDLEELMCDLLNAEQPVGSLVSYRTFRDGKDKGIDFLFSTKVKAYTHVGQVKHYYRTGFDGLLRHLKNTEAAKVVKLSPDKYILATSVDLSPKQVMDIRDVFSPYCQSISDIYGKADLNRLIEAHDEVLRKHFKLWFSDTTVLEMILKTNLTYRSADFVKGELSKRLRLYVPTPMLDKAQKALEDNHFVIITGEPGVGKSTLAEMLSYAYISQGYEFLYINDDIRDAEQFLKNDDSKQVIYYDDFLGSNAAEINRSQSSESTLVNLISRVKRHANKKFILTTRTHIFSSALAESEKLSRAGLRSGETIFTLKEYDLEMKRKLLQNHIDEAEMSEDYKTVLREPDLFDFITFHRSFNPRSVEFITAKHNLVGLTPEVYQSFIKANFNDPDRIWRHAYLHQIGDSERVALNTLLSFDATVELTDLEKAFDQRIKTDVKVQQSRELNAFKRAISRLDKGFIVRRNGRISFINPSLKDFLTNYIKTDQHEIRAIVNAIRFIQQHSPLMQRLMEPYRIVLPEGVKKDMLLNFMDYVQWNNRDRDLLRLFTFVDDEVKNPKKDEFLEDMIEAVHNWEELFEDHALDLQFNVFLEKIQGNHLLKRVFDLRIATIVDRQISETDDIVDAVELLEYLTDTFDIDFETYDAKIINAQLENYFDVHIKDEVNKLKENITRADEAIDLTKSIADLEYRVHALGIDFRVDVSELQLDWDEIASENELDQRDKWLKFSQENEFFRRMNLDDDDESGLMNQL